MMENNRIAGNDLQIGCLFYNRFLGDTEEE